MLLYCIRHGESTFNAEGRIQGRLDVPLSELGRLQSQAAGVALGDKPIEAIYASPLRRAAETAEIIAKPFGQEVQSDPRLMEINVGVFQGKMPSELRQLHADALARWSSGDPEFVIPGGESRRQVAKRGREAFQAIRETGQEEVIVVAHGGIIVATLKMLKGIPLSQPPYSLENGSITTLRWDPDGSVHVVELNRIDHLHSVGLAGGGDLTV